jgi:hypothetical protein
MCLLALLVAGPGSRAFADRPIREIRQIDDTFVRIDLSSTCGFTVTQHAEGTITDIVFTDENGNLTRILEHYQITADYFTANGNRIDVSNANGPLRILYNPDGSFVVYTLGTFDFTTYPGRGTIHGSAGQTIFTYSADGELLSVEARGRVVSDLSAFCAALAP